MNKIYIIVFVLIHCYVSNAQNTYTIKSKDGKVSAKHYIGFGEGLDSVLVKNKKSIFKFSYHKPMFEFEEITTDINVNHIKKIKNNKYLLLGIGGNLNLETQLNLIFIKKDKILKYYVVMSNNKSLRDIDFKYLPKTKEVVIPITTKHTPLDYIYEVDIKENKLSEIKPFKQTSSRYYYKIKTQ